ncbi:MAG TPA: hypothetical protein VHL31_22670 [Geminicoccus sp.]|jgi:hypothetical protein|uniref:hypothetical protein n=1 Tax=Geminicoccus sp. TaxID=2024832 RepID=UPI002E3678C6|nr:hypothetical protein [Geminicoccus sp.]HEX2529085.1 hypothetical protein [Geminicoccus sp.]
MQRRAVLGGLLGIAAMPSLPEAASRNFVAWNCMRWNGGPTSLVSCGLRTMTIFHESSMVTGKDPDFGKIDAVAAQIRRAQPKLVTLDIERWYPEYSGGRRRLIAVVDYLRDRIPSTTKLGYWGIMPGINYGAYLAGGSRLAEQRALNRAMRPLAAKVDWIMPSLYTPETDRARWSRHADIVLSEAHSFGKPVMPWLWMQYLETSPVRSIRYDLLPGSFFRAQLEKCWAKADSVCLWGTRVPQSGGKIQRLDWNGNAGWWRETKSFLRSHGKNLDACRA